MTGGELLLFAPSAWSRPLLTVATNPVRLS